MRCIPCQEGSPLLERVGHPPSHRPRPNGAHLQVQQAHQDHSRQSRITTHAAGMAHPSTVSLTAGAAAERQAGVLAGRQAGNLDPPPLPGRCGAPPGAQCPRSGPARSRRQTGAEGSRVSAPIHIKQQARQPITSKAASPWQAEDRQAADDTSASSGMQHRLRL